MDTEKIVFCFSAPASLSPETPGSDLVDTKRRKFGPRTPVQRNTATDKSQQLRHASTLAMRVDDDPDLCVTIVSLSSLYFPISHTCDAPSRYP
jgi:hypothetical protein